jgi:signal transduction histidine kinase
MGFDAESPLELLLVEDNPGDARLIETYLEKADMTFLPREIEYRHETTLGDGLDALDAEQFDLLLLDLGLPECSGLETLDRTLGRHDDVPVVVLTGLQDREVAVEAIQQGAQDFLNKDKIDQEVLTRAIRYAIERKEREEALRERTEQLEILNRIVRHDIRNDVAVIQGWGEALDEYVEESGDAYLQRIDDAARHIVDLTSTARDVVETIGGEETLDVDTVSLRPLLREEVEKKQSAYDEATFVCGGEIPAVDVRANEMLSSVFGNLFTNAVRHNDKDEPRVEISVDVDGSTVRAAVADNGPGIPDAHKETIFGKGERSLDSPGTGIGLYLVDYLVDEFGGEVTVEDNDPEGAVFTVDLVRAPPE